MEYEMEPAVEYYYHIDPEATGVGATEELVIKRPEEGEVEDAMHGLVIKRPDEEGVEYVVEDPDKGGLGVGLVDCGDGTYTYYPLAAEDTPEDSAAAAAYLIDPSVLITEAGESADAEEAQVEYTYVYHNEDETAAAEEVAIQME